MKLETQSVKIEVQEPGIDGLLKHVEKCGRTCYKSEDKIDQFSARRFVSMLKTSGHLSVLEHGTLYLKVNVPSKDEWTYSEDSLNVALVSFFEENQYSRVNWYLENGKQVAYVTTNYRVIIENRLDEEEICKLMVPWEEKFDKRVTVRMFTSVGISRELNRHRCHSISEQSTRYCNYSKDKFGNELTFIIPSFADIDHAEVKPSDASIDLQILYYLDPTSQWLCQMKSAEQAYMYLIDSGLKPQEARYVLPLSLKTELVHTAYLDDWEQFFKQRCDVHAHPDMRVLANLIKSQFMKEGIIDTES